MMDLKKILVKENDTKLTNEIYLNSFGLNESLNLKAAAYQNIAQLQNHQINMHILLPEISYSKYNFLRNNNLNFIIKF